MKEVETSRPFLFEALDGELAFVARSKPLAYIEIGRFLKGAPNRSHFKGSCRAVQRLKGSSETTKAIKIIPQYTPIEV